jgi:hypothetical protein
MTAPSLRKYIDILQEYEDPKLLDPDADKPTDAAEPKPAGNKPADTDTSDVRSLQQALVDAGFELPRFGVDGKMGPETQAAIRAAEMVMGRKPTGKITTQELAGIGQKIENNALTQALGAIEAVLSKYKIKTDESLHPDDQLVLENINLYTAQEQLEIWRTLTEADIYLPPNTGGQARDAGLQARMQMARNTNPAIARSNNPFGIDPNKKPSASTPPYVPTKSAGKLGKFMGKLGGVRGLAKKVGARVVGAAATGPAALVIGTGMALWTAYDIGKALYDTFTEKELGDLDPADQKIIADNLQTVIKYQQDANLLGTLPDDLQLRLARVTKGLDALAVDQGLGSVKPEAQQAKPQPASTSTQGTLDRRAEPKRDF